MSRTLESAKEICAVALRHGVHSWENPEAVTDNDVLKRADELVDVSLQASAKASINDAVVEILFAAQVEPLSEPTREAYTRRFGALPTTAETNGNAPEQDQPAAASAFVQPQVSAKDASAMAKASAAPLTPQSPAQSEPAPSPAPAAGEGSIEDIFPGYDNQTIKDIEELVLVSAKSGDLSLEEWERIKAYEAVNKKRKTILLLEPEFKASEPPPSEILQQVFSPPGDSHNTGHTASLGDDDVPQFQVTSTPATATQSPVVSDDASLTQVYAGETQTRAQQEGLPVPPHVDLGQAPIVPVNITDISDQDLSALGATFHSLFARAQWLISQEEGRAAAAEHLERETEHDAYVQAYSLHREQIPEEKRTQPTALEAARKQAEKDSETNEKVRTWRSRRVRHGIEVRELKALALGFDKGVWRIDKELDRRARAATTARAAS